MSAFISNYFAHMTMNLDNANFENFVRHWTARRFIATAQNGFQR